MRTLKANWLPGGEVELHPIPLMGQRELKEMSLKDAEIESLFTQNMFFKMAGGLLAADRILQKMGPAKAKDSWDDYILTEFDGTKAFLWPLENFAENLKATKEKFVYRNLAVVDDAEAQVKLEEFAKNLKESLEKVDKEALKNIGLRPLVALYWHLRVAGVKELIMPTGKAPLNWDLKAKKEVLDLLAEVVTSEQLEELTPKATRPVDMEDFKPLSVADVQGKSVSLSSPSTESSPGSVRFSVDSTAIMST